MTNAVSLLNTFGRWLVDHLGHMSLELAILAAVVFLAIKLLRIHSAAMRHLFWGLVLAKPVVTFLIASPLSLYWFLRPPSLLEWVPPPVAAVRMAPPERIRPVMPIPYDRPISVTRPSPEPIPLWQRLDRYGIAGTVWLFVALAFGVRLLGGFIYLACLRRTARVQTDGKLPEMVTVLCRELGIRRHVQVAISRPTHGPVLAGCLRPVILLPSQLCNEVPSERLRLIMAHELAHVRRCDNAVLLVQRLAEMVLFFHPAVWLCGWIMRREAETACDDLVIVTYGCAEEYADSLTRVAEMRDGITRRLLISTFAAAESNLTRRVHRILGGRIGRTTVWLTAAAVVALIVIGCLGLPTATERKNNSTDTKPAKSETEETAMAEETTSAPSRENGANVKRDGERVWIEGMPAGPVGWAWDAPLRGLQLILEYRGDRVELDELMAWSGDAFNLCHGSHWQGVAYLCTPTDPVRNVLERFGYQYTCLHNGYGAEKFDRLQPQERAEYTEKLLNKIYADLDAGRPALVGGCMDHCGEWGVVSGYGRARHELLMTGTSGTPGWGVVRGFPGNGVYERDKEGGVEGHWNGRFRGTVRTNFVGGWQNNPAFLIGLKTVSQGKEEAVIAALQRAVVLFRAPSHHIGWWGGVDYCFGEQAYREWAKELRELDYPADLGKSQPAGAYDWYEMGNMDTQVDQIVRGRSSAASFCERVAAILPGAGSHLDAAAKYYREEAAIARRTFAAFIPAYTGDETSRKTWLSDERMRENGARAIEDMLGHEQAAIAEIEKVLGSAGALQQVEAVESGKIETGVAVQESRPISRTTVKHEDGKVWIEGIKGFDPGEYADSVHGVQARILQVLGETLTYDDLICYSGFAFRIGIHDKMCPSAGHPCCGFMCIENGTRALPWRLKLFEDLPWNKKKENRAAFEAEARAAIKASIDRGIPVHYGGEEDGMIIGYADDGRRWWCLHPYYKNGREAFWHDEVKGFAGGSWPWGIVVWTEPRPESERVPARDLTLDALRQAVEMWKTEKREAYFVGKAAYAHWLNWLRDVEAGKADNPKAGMQGNGWCYDVLVHSRRIAGPWLKQRAELFSEETQKHLLAASEHYSRIVELCMADLDCPWNLALPPGKFEQWTSTMRQTQIRRIEAARDHDAAAIAEIEKALAIEGIDASVDAAGASDGAAPEKAVADEDGDQPSAVLLKDVPWVGFYQGPAKGNPEDHPLPSVMRSLVEYLGDDLGLPMFADQRGRWRWQACALIHGITGSGFAFSWEHPYGEAYLGKKLILSYEKAFAVAGYDRQMLFRSAFAAGQNYAGSVSDDEAAYRRLIVQSIRDRRRPVVAIGVIGPDEPCLICGFEDDGKVLVGWNFFRDEAREDPRLSSDADGRFVLRDWFRDLRGIIVPGDKLAPPPARRDLCIEALRQNLALLCGPEDISMWVPAYRAWIDYLLEPIPGSIAADLRQVEPIHEKHNGHIGELAERRAYAAAFLEQASELLPQGGDALQRAQYCYQAMHDLLWRVWQTVGVWHKTDDAKLLRYTKPEFRLELASLVRRLQVWDAEAAKHIRDALTQVGTAEADLPTLPVLPPVEGLRDLGIESPLPAVLGRLWETPEPEIPGVPAPDGESLAVAVRAAAAATAWPIPGAPARDNGLAAWAEGAGWQVNVVDMPPDETMLAGAQRINNVILSCLYGLPVATTHNGNPVVVVGYNHLAGETLRVRMPGQSPDEPAKKVRIDDKGWGPTWVFLAGRLKM